MIPLFNAHAVKCSMPTRDARHPHGTTGRELRDMPTFCTMTLLTEPYYPPLIDREKINGIPLRKLDRSLARNNHTPT